MGLGKSRPLAFPFEEAVKKLTAEEQSRLEACWRRWRSPGSELLNRRAFRDVVLSAAVPEAVAAQLFAAFVPRGREGLSWRELIVAIVVLTKSTKDERIGFLFHCFSDDGDVVVTAKVLERLRNAGEPLPKGLQRAIASTDKLTEEQFRPWIEGVKEDIPLASWLLDSPPALTCAEPIATFYQSLAGVTHLEEAEIVELEKQWWSLADPRLRKMDRERFACLVSPPLPGALVPGLFGAFDENRDEQIDFKELVCGLSSSARGPSIERCKFCFKIFDKDKDGLLNREEVAEMAERLVELGSGLDATVSPAALASQLLSRSSGGGGLSPQDFLLWAVDRPPMEALLNLLHQLAHVVLGLTPTSKRIEGDIVRSWYQRSLKGGLEEGQEWFLISSTWWNHWEHWIFSSSPETERRSVRGDSIVEWSGETVKIVGSENSGTSVEGSLPPTPPVTRPPARISGSEGNASSSCGSSIAGTSAEASGSRSSSSMASPRRRLSIGARRSWSPCPRLGSLSSTAATLVPAAADHAPKPGSLDNSALLDKEKHPWSKLPSLSSEGGLLRKGIEEERDYVRVPAALWNALVRWYGGGVNSPPLPRKVILGPTKQLELELYPVTVTIVRHQAGGASSRPSYTSSTGSAFTTAFSTAAASVSRSLQDAAREWQVHNASAPPRRVPLHRLCLSRSGRIGELSSLLSTVLRLSPESSRLWLLTPGGGRELDDPEREMMLLEEEDLPLSELNVATGSLVLLEVRNKDLTWPEEMSRLAKSLGTGEALRAPAVAGTTKGVTGLYNLGNTCYMNSALQCCSNTPTLTMYFEKNIHRAELNRENALGMKGNVALAYAELIRELWSGRSRFVAPLKLKATIGKYASRFDDVNQHDCQELLAFLLDGLHEDLNRVTTKPYTELKDSAGRADALVAAEAWDNHLKRNQSIIVDLFHGLLKSEVECGACGGVSTRFDPFTFLSLPLPLDDSLLLCVVVVGADGTRPTQFGLRAPAEDSVEQLRGRIGKMAAVDPELLFLLELSHTGAILRFLDLEEKVKRLACIQGSCLLFAFTIPPAPLRSLTNAENPRIPNGSAVTETPAPSHSRNVSSVSDLSTTTTVGAPVPPLGPSVGFVIGLHRKFEQQDTYFLAHQRTKAVVFGLPLILPAEAPSGWTGESLYASVWAQVSRLVSPASQAAAGLSHNHARDGDQEPGGPEFPFRLALCNAAGSRCAVCPWFRLCHGCPLPRTGPVELEEGVFVAVDWDLTAVHLRYQHSQEMSWEVDASVAAAAEAHRSPVSLESCLHSFTQEEELGDKDPVYCSRCQAHHPAKKRLSIWKMPPVLIVHFKRFQYVGNRWVKSSKMVTFPKKDFNPTSFMASMEPLDDEGLLETAAVTPPSVAKMGNGSAHATETAPAIIRRPSGGTVVVGEPRSSADVQLLVDETTKAPSGSKSPVRKLISSVKGRRGGALGEGSEVNPAYEEATRRRTESTVSLTPMVNPNDHRLRPDADPTALDYDLYAVSCHYGVLGAGHYVCYAKHSDDQWCLYNDSKTKMVGEEEVEGNMAYLLFYQRRGLDTAAYLPDVPAAEASAQASSAASTASDSAQDDKCAVM